MRIRHRARTRLALRGENDNGRLVHSLNLRSVLSTPMDSDRLSQHAAFGASPTTWAGSSIESLAQWPNEAVHGCARCRPSNGPKTSPNRLLVCGRTQADHDRGLWRSASPSTGCSDARTRLEEVSRPALDRSCGADATFGGSPIIAFHRANRVLPPFSRRGLGQLGRAENPPVRGLRSLDALHSLFHSHQNPISSGDQFLGI